MPSPANAAQTADSESLSIAEEIFVEDEGGRKLTAAVDTNPSAAVDNVDDDDEELEELVRTSFRKFHSQSAHANLSQLVSLQVHKWPG